MELVSCLAPSPVLAVVGGPRPRLVTGEARELFLGTHACCVTQTRQKMHEVKPATKDPHVHRVVNVYNDPNQLTQSSVSARATAGEKRY